MRSAVLTDLLNDASAILCDRDNEQLVHRWLRMKMHKNKVKDPDHPARLLTKAASHNNKSVEIYFFVEKCICKP